MICQVLQRAGHSLLRSSGLCEVPALILRRGSLGCFSQCFRNFVSLVLEKCGRIIDIVGQFPLRRGQGILQIGQPAERVEDLLQILGQRAVLFTLLLGRRLRLGRT